MKAFAYNKDTKEYVAEVVCQLDQIESKKQNKEVYLIPANATDKEPPKCNENEVVVFEKNKWTKKADFRRKKFWKKE